MSHGDSEEMNLWAGSHARSQNWLPNKETREEENKKLKLRIEDANDFVLWIISSSSFWNEILLFRLFEYVFEARYWLLYEGVYIENKLRSWN